MTPNEEQFLTNLKFGERLASVEGTVLRMEQRLYGNGQEGEMAAMSARISKLERVIWTIGGVLGFLTAILHGAETLTHLLK